MTATAPRQVRWPLFTQRWRDVILLHWPADPGLVAPLMPPGVRPDAVDGTTFVGLIALRAPATGPARLPGIPYLGSFPEVNVRLYSVGPDGRRGVVFLSLDAARLLPVAAARASLRLPYYWARMRVRHRGDVVSYDSDRRFPGPHARLRLGIRVGEPVAEPSDLEHFLTARWGLHAAWYGGATCYLPNEHPRWPLRRAQVTGLEEDVIEAAGLPRPRTGPVSVLYSPGVPARFGVPEPVGRRGGHLRP